MKILVLGCNGQLGRCLFDHLEMTRHDVVYTSRVQIDISNLASTKEKIKAIEPDIVINASAYTAVDNAEKEKKTAYQINCLAVSNIAKICTELDCFLIHISTDYVFDGTATQPYRETDLTNPQGVYGASKLDGEIAIQAVGCKHLIIRTAWVFSEYGNNFMKTMLNLGTEREELSVVGDQIGCPTYAHDIAQAIIAAIPILVENPKVSGIYHYCGEQVCSWFEFAHEIFSEAKNLGLKTPDKIHSLKTSEYATLSKRPLYSVLDCSRFFSVFGVKPSNLKRAINYSICNVIGKK